MDLQDEAVEVLQRLIRFNTVNPPGDERACQEYLAGYLAEAGLMSSWRAPRSARTSWRACRATSPAPCSASSATSTPCWPTPTVGA